MIGTDAGNESRNTSALRKAQSTYRGRARTGDIYLVGLTKQALAIDLPIQPERRRKARQRRGGRCGWGGGRRDSRGKTVRIFRKEVQTVLQSGPSSNKVIGEAARSISTAEPCEGLEASCRCLVESCHPAVLKSYSRRGAGSAVDSWCTVERGQGKARRTRGRMREREHTSSLAILSWSDHRRHQSRLRVDGSTPCVRPPPTRTPSNAQSKMMTMEQIEEARAVLEEEERKTRDAMARRQAKKDAEASRSGKVLVANSPVKKSPR